MMIWRSDPQGTYVVRGDQQRVEAWSTVRLPYEPRGAMVGLRADLRSALERLATRDGHVVNAVYSADDSREFVDTENVLFYNVGSASFRSLASTGIRFERSYAVPAAPDRLERTDRLHHHH